MKINNLIPLIFILLILSSCTIQYLNLENRKLSFQDDLKILNNFNISDQSFYNNNDVWFDKRTVNLSDSGLVIQCLKDTAEHESWQGKRTTNWTSGLIDTRGKVEFDYGLWIITAKLNSLWPAIWLLKPDYIPDGFSKGQIIPEVDIVETIHDKFKHTVHWGFSNDKFIYRLYATGKNIRLYDDKFHDFAVDCLPNGYDFYIDGIRTASLRSDNPQFVSDQKNYLIINNAATSEDHEESIIVIKSVKFYK